MAALQAGTIPVMVAEADSQSSPWRELLARIQPLPEPPALILASRLADERLWAEALNLGAYDVLAKPFAPHELIRSVTNAWLHWQGLRDHRHRALRDRRAVAYWNAAAG
jgi:DNA-binding response OmpR family regulator